MGETEPKEEDTYLIDSWKFIQSLVGNCDANQYINGRLLKERVTSSLLPFLRCSAVFFQLLVGVNLPEELKRSEQLSVSSEMNLLCKYLNLSPNLKDVLSVEALQKDATVKSMIERWCGDIRREFLKQFRPISDCFLESRRLIDLPEQYSTLIKRASGFKCPTVGDSSRSPALCLICGEMICSQCYCCVNVIREHSFGASTVHAQQCGQGTGAFLRIRDCEVYLLYNQKKGFFMPAPYLDAYGEPDRGFHRGNPLFLDKDRYEKLQEYWLKHKIPITIVRAMETNRNLIAFEWNAI